MTLGPGGPELGERLRCCVGLEELRGFHRPYGPRTSDRQRLHAALEARWAQGCLPWGGALGALSLGSQLWGPECRVSKSGGPGDSECAAARLLRRSPAPFPDPSSTTTSKSLGLLRVYPGAPLPPSLCSAPSPFSSLSPTLCSGCPAPTQSPSARSERSCRSVRVVENGQRYSLGQMGALGLRKPGRCLCPPAPLGRGWSRVWA